MQKIILASQSPRRKQLLQWAEVPFVVIPANTDEIIPNNTPFSEVPIHIAREKAQFVQNRIKEQAEGRSIQDANLPVLAADTIVVLGDEIIGKPENRRHAIEILTKLSGNIHQVITGVVVLHGDSEISFSDITDVSFHELTKEQITFYVDTYEPYDKAGAYAIQEWIGVIGIKCINGDFYNVMGLPVSRVIRELEKLNYTNLL